MVPRPVGAGEPRLQHRGGAQAHRSSRSGGARRRPGRGRPPACGPADDLHGALRRRRGGRGAAAGDHPPFGGRLVRPAGPRPRGPPRRCAPGRDRPAGAGRGPAAARSRARPAPLRDPTPARGGRAHPHLHDASHCFRRLVGRRSHARAGGALRGFCGGAAFAPPGAAGPVCGLCRLAAGLAGRRGARRPARGSGSPGCRRSPCRRTGRGPRS
jgi:hypothetical protein